MAVTTFATDATITTMQPALASGMASGLIEGSRVSAYARIVSALHEGGYSLSALLPGTTPSPWGVLRMLEVRLVALDLLGGGGTSVVSQMGGDTWKAWAEWVEGQLTQIRDGWLAIINDSTGAIQYGRQPGGSIISDERDPGINLDDACNWTDADELETNA